MDLPFTAYSGDNPYIFVSYAHRDSATVYPELSWLHDQGVNIWYDEGIKAGSDWREELAVAISGAKVFLYFVSTNAVNSRICRKEVNFAVEQNIPILAIHLEETELPVGLSFTLSDRQGILKYGLPDDTYRNKMITAVEMYLQQDTAQNDDIVFPSTNSGNKYSSAKSRKNQIVLASVLIFFAAILLYNSKEDVVLVRGGALTEPVTVLAVLPFELEGISDASLSDVATLEVTNRLSKYPDLYVVSSKATFSPQLASLMPAIKQKRLNADHILSGVMSEDEQGYLLSVDLLGSEQEKLWRNTYRFGIDAVSQIGMQRRLSMDVADQLGTGTKYKASEYCEPTQNLEAQRAFHRADLKLNQRGQENILEAEVLLQKALKLDPGYSHAYSALAVTYLYLQRSDLAYTKTLVAEVAQKALDLCPTLGVAYKIVVPRYAGVENDWIEQEMEWRDALAMDPNNVWLLDQYAFNLEPLGVWKNIDTIRDRAKRIEPLSVRSLIAQAWENLSPETLDRAIALADEAENAGDKSCNVYFLRLKVGLMTSEEATLRAWSSFPEKCGLRDGTRAQFEALGPSTNYLAQHNLEARREVIDYMRAHLEENPNKAMFVGAELSDLKLAFDAVEYGMANDRFLYTAIWWSDEDGWREFRRDPRFLDLVEEFEFVDYWKAYGWPDDKCSPLGDSFVCDN